MPEEAKQNASPDIASPDIDRGRIATVYANALLGSTDKAGKTSALLDEYQSLVEDVLQNSAQFDQALASPRISIDDKMSLLDRVFAEKMSTELLTFLKVVCQHGRMDCLREIYQSARQEFNRRSGRVEVYATTATMITERTRNSIIDTLKKALGSEVELYDNVDEDLLGGMVIRIGDTVYDGSVLNKLAQLKQETMRNTSRAIREGGNRFASE